MEQERNLHHAIEMMDRFAENTGLAETAKPRRYLWTDAFAVCNYLELHRLTGKDSYKNLALRLVDQVHQVLGRHRDDDPRSGWISGLDERIGAAHPTRGGLRIGKMMPERPPDEPFDEQLEWDRDGQYFHYLTKWMHALHRVAGETGKSVYADQGRELAEAAHRGFTYQPRSAGIKRMYWKMSIDLSRPLVPAMGLHDPLDGFITYLELQDGDSSVLAEEIAELKVLCRDLDWGTDDPLGIGGMLGDILRLVQLTGRGVEGLGNLAKVLLKSAAEGLEHYIAQNPLGQPPEYRLAFRELGLAIGLQAVARIEDYLRGKTVENDILPAAALRRLAERLSLARMIEDFWLQAEIQQTAGWTAHADINMVMLATSLIPDGFFGKIDTTDL